jgi:hypothetical protein
MSLLVLLSLHVIGLQSVLYVTKVIVFVLPKAFFQDSPEVGFTLVAGYFF